MVRRQRLGGVPVGAVVRTGLPRSRLPTMQAGCRPAAAFRREFRSEPRSGHWVAEGCRSAVTRAAIPQAKDQARTRDPPKLPEARAPVQVQAAVRGPGAAAAGPRDLDSWRAAETRVRTARVPSGSARSEACGLRDARGRRRGFPPSWRGARARAPVVALAVTSARRTGAAQPAGSCVRRGGPDASVGLSARHAAAVRAETRFSRRAAEHTRPGSVAWAPAAVAAAAVAAEASEPAARRSRAEARGSLPRT